MNFGKKKDEFYEEMERDDTEENIINSEKKKNSSKFIKIGIVSLISILFIIYLISNHCNKKKLFLNSRKKEKIK